MRTLVASWRILRVIGMVAQGLWLIAFAMPRTDAAGWHRIMQRWAVKLLRCLGVTVRVTGEPQPGAVLMVANHVSWLDIPALHASSPRTRFVSKSAVAHWPLLGRLARAGGTLFIERERKRDALRVVHEVAAALKNQDAVAVFPEGTTGPGHEVLPFHANLLQAAITTATTIQPIVLRYSEPGLPVSVAAQYIDDTTLVESVMKVCRARGVVVDVRFLAPEPAGELDRRVLGERLHERMAAELRSVLQSG
ncbi:MAG: lysophospholipid acyltransferase family protein [Vitreoscilla sp.]